MNHQVCHLRLYDTPFHTSYHWWIMSFPYYNRPILLNLLKDMVPGSIHRIHNRTQSSGPVMLITQRCYDVNHRTIHLLLAIARPLSGNKTSYFDPYCHLTHFLPVVSLWCLVLLMWSFRHALGSYQQPGITLTYQRHTISYFSIPTTYLSS